ncbi:hypothetical protein Y1Q_0017602 [Alligator mississippiensis]|uniref:Uncharacterized protein n=1 Tax=Alligator mississippiensis TaxID=8496 RepID=A0A151P2N0_ALLMI|nr:hypothetical protein Y1Q_0017602 [Alligator mississippiensis]
MMANGRSHCPKIHLVVVRNGLVELFGITCGQHVSWTSYGKPQSSGHEHFDQADAMTSGRPSDDACAYVNLPSCLN